MQGNFGIMSYVIVGINLVTTTTKLLHGARSKDSMELCASFFA